MSRRTVEFRKQYAQKPGQPEAFAASKFPNRGARTARKIQVLVKSLNKTRSR